MIRIALFTVLYPGAETYLDEFITSVRNQSYKNFDLLVVNDNCKDLNLASSYHDLNIIELNGDGTISGNRAIGINYAISNNYDYLYLCDVDDYMFPTRVDYILKKFENYDIIVNDLNIVDSERNVMFKNYFQKSISENVLLDKDFLRDKNIFGFSNSAMRVSSLSKVSFPRDLRIVDWYYFTQLLIKGLKAKFVAEALTEYRQHSKNMIGISSYTVDMFKRLIVLKIKHYEYFKDIDHEYKNLYNEMLLLTKMSDYELRLILENNTKNTPYPMWWQNVKF